MASRKGIECPTWRPRSKLTSEVHLHVCGTLFTLDKELLSVKSSRISKLLQKNPQADLSILLQDIPANNETMELVSRFCHGFDIALSTQNSIWVVCAAHYLGMTDTHCPNNLLNRALAFFQRHVITSWDNSINALKAAEHIFQPACNLGLVDYCVETLISKALENPCILGEPVTNTSDDDDDDDISEGSKRVLSYAQPSAKRKLFIESEDLTSLSLRLYAPMVVAMTRRGVSHKYLAASICQYAKTWLFDTDEVPTHEMNARREIVETLVSLFSDQIHVNIIIPCDILSKMLKFAIALDASDQCKNTLELRIGKQLDRASVNDLLIPSRGYARDEKYDTESVRRILKNFYCGYGGLKAGQLGSVSELMDEFLAELAADIDLKIGTFLEIADMCAAAMEGTEKVWDGIYRAVDVYLEKHGHLTETERERVCRALDCGRLSVEACEHAARNERLPMRVVVQVLFVVQLKLRDAMPIMPKGVAMGGGGGVKAADMDRMGRKVMELERECRVMKREMERGSKTTSVWREMKRKLGCLTHHTINDCNCHVKRKKVHPS